MMRHLWICLLSLFLALPAWADIPDDKSGRITEYQSRRIELKEAAGNYSLTQNDHPIGDEALVRLAGDSEAVGDLTRKMTWRQTYQLAVGLAGIPLGGYLFYDNLYGSGSRQDSTGKAYASPPRFAPYPPGSLGSYLLALAGGLLVYYGGSLLYQWGAERFGFAHPNLLGLPQAKALRDRYDQQLLDELVLTPSDVATESLAQAPVASQDLALPGSEGTAAYGLKKAVSTLEAQRGKGFKLYLVTGSVKDWNGTSESWAYYFAHVDRPDRFKVTVTPFGAPTVVATKEKEEYVRFQGQLNDLVKSWKVDSPKALESLKERFAQKGVAFFDTADMTLYPYYQPSQLPDPNWAALSTTLAQPALRPIWIVEAKGVRLAVDAATGKTIPFDQEAIQQEGK